MKLIRISAILLLACGAATGFPASTSTPSFKETFAIGADSFDLNLHSLTLMPYETTPGSGNYRCKYSIRPIRGLPVDMAGATVINSTTPTSGVYAPISPVTSLPTIYGIALSTFQIFKSGEVVFQNANSSSSLTLRALNSDAFKNSAGFLKLEASRLMTDGKLTIQFNYVIDPEYSNDSGSLLARPLVRNTFQVEIFPDGMIRYSYFSVDVTFGEVGLISSASPTPADLNYSTSILKAPDVVTPENAGTATIALELPTTEAASFQYATVSGSAVAPSDFTATSGTSSIAVGAGTANLSVPVINDALDESPESLALVVRDSVNPNWIFAESRIWILDDDAVTAGSGPRIDLSGNRVIVLPPDPSDVTITSFRLLSLSGGTLVNPIDQSQITPNSTFTLQAGAAGLIASGLGIHLTVEAIHSGGTSVPVGFDLDGGNSSPVFDFTTDRIEATEGGFASLGVSASQVDASVSYQMFPLSAQPSTDYAPMVKTLEFKDGLARIEIPLLADGVTEGNEEFLVRLINPSPGSFIGAISRARVVVKDGGGELRSPTAQVLPNPRPSGRVVNRYNTDPAKSPIWRFVGEPLWRPSNSHGWNVREGLHQMDFRVNASVWKLYMAPESYLNQQATINDLNFSYSSFDAPTSGPTFGTSTGSLRVDLLPVGTTGQWRRVGEVGPTSWRTTGAIGVETGVPVGTQLVEFTDTVSGYDAPSVRPVRILSNLPSTLTATYQVRPASGVVPAPIPEPDLRSTTGPWTHIPIPVQSTDFKVSFEYKLPNISGILTALIGLSPGMVGAETSLVATLRTTASGFTALNGTTYVATASPVLAPNQWHLVEFEVKPTSGTYNLHVTPPTGARVTIRNAASLRTGAPAGELGYLSMSSTLFLQSVRGIRVEKTHPTTSTWKIIEFPDQVTTFDLALELQVRTGGSFTGNPFQFLFGLSDGRANDPTARIGPVLTPTTNDPVVFPQPANLGAVGRYPPTVVRLHVDLAMDTYEVRGETDAILNSGTLPATLTKANHFYLKPSSSDVAAYSISDSILPPAYLPPTGTSAAATWSHIPITPQTGRFSLTCDIRTVGQTVGSGDLIDSLFGLSATKVTQDSEIAVTLRAKLPATGTGSWDAHSGVDFIKEGDLPIVDGKLHHATLHIDIPAKTYRISIAPEGGGPVVILEQGTFRQQAAELRYLTLRSLQGRLEVTNVRGPLPHPLDSPAYFTGQIETPNGFGTGTVVADHVVMTSARLVFDSTTGNFVRGITWRRSEGGYSAIPDACEPSHILLPNRYCSSLLATTAGDSHDVALLVFRPLDVPESDNAPGGGCFSGFQVDDGSGSWTTAPVKRFPSFPVSGIAAASLGRVHSTDMSAVSFSGSGVLRTASGVSTPPGSEGAAVFVQGADMILRPAAVCIGAADGTTRFRTIDAEIAEAIYQANSYQRQHGILQDLVKGGVFYINQTVEKSTEASRVHILSNAIPPAATWTVKRLYGTTLGPFPGGLNFVGDSATYLVTFGAAPPGFSGPTPPQQQRSVSAGTTWNLPSVYTPDPPASYETWVDAHYDEFEAESPVAAPSTQTPWLGVDNLTAYAFGFDPNGGTTPFATTTTPGFPVVTVTPPTIAVEFLRRTDLGLSYQIQYSDTLADWTTITPAATAIPLTGWERVSWTSPSLPGQPVRKFVRTRVTLD